MSDSGRSLFLHYEFSSLSRCGPSVKPARGQWLFRSNWLFCHKELL